MLRIFLAGLVILAAGVSAGWADSPALPGGASSAEVANSDLSADDQAMLKEAADKFNRSDIKGALDTLNQVARQNPKLIPPRLILAQWFAQTGNQPAVRVSLEKAVEENPDDPEAYVLLGEIALNQGELTAADLLFQKASSCDVSSVNEKRQKTLSMRILRGQARLWQSRQQWTKMQQTLSTLLKEEGENPLLCRQIALSFFHLDKEQAAHDWFARADQLDGDKGGLPAAGRMAVLYREKGDSAKAAEWMKKALQSNPDSPATMRLSLTSALDDGNMNAAKEAADRLYAADGKGLESLKLCGIVALYRDDFAGAEKYFREALAAAPDDPDVTNSLALALCEQSDPNKVKQALQYAAANVQKQGNNRDFLATYGWVLYKSGNPEEGLKALEQSVADGRMVSATAYYIAAIKSDQGDTATAKKLLQLALSNSSPFSKRTAAEALLAKLPQ